MSITHNTSATNVNGWKPKFNWLLINSRCLRLTDPMEIPVTIVIEKLTLFQNEILFYLTIPDNRSQIKFNQKFYLAVVQQKRKLFLSLDKDQCSSRMSIDWTDLQFEHLKDLSNRPTWKLFCNQLEGDTSMFVESRWEFLFQSWLNTCGKCERTVTIFKGVSSNKQLSQWVAKCVFLSLMMINRKIYLHWISTIILVFSFIYFYRFLSIFDLHRTILEEILST